MYVDLQARLRVAAAGILALATMLGTGASAQARHRYPPRLPFDHRPALSQAAVGALSLGVLAAGAEAAIESEFADGYLPLFDCPPPYPGYAIYP